MSFILNNKVNPSRRPCRPQKSYYCLTIGLVFMLTLSLMVGAGCSIKPGQSDQNKVKVTVPNVVGMVQSTAETAITAAGLSVGTVSDENSPTVPSGDVISQNPAAGTSVAQKSAVNLAVSSGPNVARLESLAIAPYHRLEPWNRLHYHR